MKKYIIGLGCSWTQGEGGYTEDIWKSHNGRVQVVGRDDYYLRKIEHENSWVNVLCRDHFPDYTSVNLGVRGIGNIASANQLHFCDVIDWQNSTGIIIFMLSGTERFDVFGNNILSNNQDDFYSKNSYKHYKFRTVWPFPNKDDKFTDVYARELHSETFCAVNTITSIINVQNFAKLHGYKLIIANAYNRRGRQNELSLIDWFNEHAHSISNKVDWKNYIHNYVDYNSFIQILLRFDKLIPENSEYFDFYRNRTWPSTYLTNCNGAHPTLLGHKVIAEEISKWIKNYVN